MFISENKEYDRLVKQTYQLVEICHNDYEKGNSAGYLYMLLGLGYCEVKSRSGQKHNYRAVVDAIHNYQKDHPNKKVQEAYFNMLCELANSATNLTGYSTVINYINYELEKQKKYTSAFEIDSVELLTRLKNNIEKRKDSLGYDYGEVIDMYDETRVNVENKSGRKK